MALMESASSSLPEDSQQALRAEQLWLLLAGPLNLGVTLVIVAILAAVLLPVTELWRIALFCACVFVLTLHRIALAAAWRRDTKRLQRLQMWWWYLLISTLLGGAAWGLCNFLLLPDQSPPQQTILVLVSCTFALTSAMSFAADPRIAWSFLIPFFLPLELQLYTHSGELGASMATMGLVYLLFIANVINHQYTYIKSNIMLHFAEKERELRQTEIAQALSSNQEKLQALFELSPLGCVLMRVDGKPIEANRAFLQMLGCGAEDLERLFSAGLTSEAYRKESRHRFQQLIRQGGTETFVCEFVRQDGSLVPVSLHRMVFDAGDGQHYVWTLVEDITERRQHDEQLLALNNRLSLATQAGGIGVWEMDLEHDTLLWDVRMCEMYGIEPIAGPVPLDMPGTVLHPDEASAVVNAFAAALNDPLVDHYTAECRIILRDRSERWISSSCVVRRDESGRAQRVIGVVWDITESRRVERMKSEFVSTVSHELRTPLTSIRGSLGLVASGVVGELPVAAQELIDIAYKNSERLSLLINDILDIEKVESGKMRLDLKAQEVSPLIQQVAAANQGFAQSFSVHLALSADIDAIVVVDPDRFMQVMANLISNAVKFSGAGDSVEIAVMDAQARVRIEVRDRGPGIPVDFRERIFKRFSQADASDARVRGGSGLGLAITKTLVERMHGEVGFTARVGGGTVFFVEFPRQ